MVGNRAFFPLSLLKSLCGTSGHILSNIRYKIFQACPMLLDSFTLYAKYFVRDCSLEIADGIIINFDKMI